MESKNDHIIKLASEIIDDIEFSRIDAQAMLLKTTRLARYVDDTKIRAWLKLEMQGYSKDDISLKYMSLTGRWTDKERREGYWFPLSQVEAKIAIETEKLKQLKIPDSSASNARVIVRDMSNTINLTAIRISKLGVKVE